VKIAACITGISRWRGHLGDLPWFVENLRNGCRRFFHYGRDVDFWKRQPSAILVWGREL